MSRINTNVTALISARILNANNYDLNKSLERLSTGLRINRGADDPAGLITSENLRKQIRGTEAAVKNAERAVNIVSTAEGALNEVNAMLLDMQALLSEAANTGGMSTEEIDANQTQVDSIINSIDRISNSTEFEGIKLLNGTLAYTTTGVDTTKIADKTIKAAKLIDGASMTVDLAVTTSAQTGISYLSGATVSDNACDGLGSVHDDIQDHLVEIPDQTRHRGQVGVEVRHHLGHVFPLISGDRDRALDGLVQISSLLLIAARMRELLHSAHDV